MSRRDYGGGFAGIGSTMDGIGGMGWGNGGVGNTGRGIIIPLRLEMEQFVRLNSEILSDVLVMVSSVSNS